MGVPYPPRPQLARAVQRTVYTTGPPSNCIASLALLCTLYGLLLQFFGSVGLILKIDFCRLVSKRRLVQLASEVSGPKCVAW